MLGLLPAVRLGAPDSGVFEAEHEISAHAVLITQAPAHLDARGTAAGRSSGQEVAEIADEIAAAGALRRLSDRLLEAAAEDVSALDGRSVPLTG
jgi:hypothetical protein